MKVKRALISVFNKSGVEPFAKGLTDMGVTVISTGGAAKLLKDSGIPVTLVEEVTGSPRCSTAASRPAPAAHGRHPGAAPRARAMQTIAEPGIEPIDLSSSASTLRGGPGGAGQDEMVIEKIDIGGPSMIRAAAKNHSGVAVVTSHDDYGEILEELRPPAS